MVDGDPFPLDIGLLHGFEYACQPACGLCCFAEPRVEPEERSVLLRIAPAAKFMESQSATYLASYPEGGACNLLRDSRCSAHAVRPHPCQEFPVTVHLGSRLQATLVLGCPGVDLAALEQPGAFSTRAPPRGFESELASVRYRIGPHLARRWKEGARRRSRIVRTLERTGRWVDEEEARFELRDRPLGPGPEDFPAQNPPPAEEGLDRLPLFFDGRKGPVALAEGLGGWEALELNPTGGVERHLGQIPPPTHPPRLEPGAERLLEGYLRYFLERDVLFASLLPRLLETEEGTVTEWAAMELRTIGALVISRAVVRAKLRGASGDRLSRDDLAAGIRASDQDLLDVPTWGDRL
jgi:Fe-S-cluster containining protein